MAMTVKGECRNTGKTHFKKGMTPWNKGKKVHSAEDKKRISEERKEYFANNDHPQLGKPVKEDTKAKISESLKHRFKDLVRKPNCYPCLSEWRKITEKIFTRDEYKCQECGKRLKRARGKGVIQCHHIDYDTSNNEESNLITLCAPCHAKTGYDREKWITHYKAKCNLKLILDDSRE